MRKSEQKVLWALAIGFGFVLLSRPNCNGGCKTLAEHLITHGVDVLL